MTQATAVADRRLARARNGTLTVFAVNGFAFASWMSRVPDVKARLDLTPGGLSVLLLSLSVGAVVGLPLAGRVAHRIGASNAVRLGAVLAVPGTLLAAVAVQAQAAPMLVMPGLFLLGLGTGLWDVSQNLEGTVVERGIGRAIMPWFHAAFSLGTVVGALLGALLTYLDVPIAGHISVTSVLSIAMIVAATARFVPAFDEPDDTGDTSDTSDTSDSTTPTRTPARSAWTEPRTLLVGVVVLAAAFAEGTANDWMAVAFVDGHHVTEALGVVALAVFLSFMTLGRILGTNLLDRYGRVVVLRALFVAAVLGCALVVWGPVWLAFAGAAVWGVGASLGFPVGMSAAADDPDRAAMRLSVVSTIGYLAFLGGPPLLGFLGDHFGVLPALLAVGAASVLALAVVPAARPEDAEPEPVGSATARAD